jgi:hypothetical protein
VKGSFALIFPVGLARPLLALIRGERPHFVATETVAAPSSATNGSERQKEACLCRGEQRESGRNQ